MMQVLAPTSQDWTWWDHNGCSVIPIPEHCGLVSPGLVYERDLHIPTQSATAPASSTPMPVFLLGVPHFGKQGIWILTSVLIFTRSSTLMEQDVLL